MKSKIVIYVFLVVFTLSSYSFTVVSYASCFQEFRWCNALAENTFNSSQWSASDQEAYVQSVKNCVSSYDGCVDPAQQ